MPSAPLKFLHLEDSILDAQLIEAALRLEFPILSLVQVDQREPFLQEIQDPSVRIVLSDYSLPDYDGISALSEARQIRPEIPFIFVSGAMGEDMAVECMKVGASDYVLKSNLKRLPAAIRRALLEADTRLALLEATRVAKVVPWQWDPSDDQWTSGYLVKDILGFKASDFRSDPALVKARVHVEDLSRFLSAFSLAQEKGRSDVDVRFQHRDDHWIWTRWTLAWLDGKYRGILQDITELHSAQEALIQSQRLETLGTMLSGITHDFGNLMMAISGTADMLELSSLAPQQRHHVQIIQNSCERALELRNELMRLARKEDAPRKVPADLNDLVQEAFRLLRHAVPKAIQVLQDVHPDPLPVQVVPGQILQVLMNLGINARDALGDKGQILLRTGRLELSESEAQEHNRCGGTYVFCEMEDTGPGIPKEIQSRIFDIFFTTKEAGKGTGLGLAMVRAIVHQHDGFLTLQTDEEHGTRFKVFLPMNQAE